METSLKNKIHLLHLIPALKIGGAEVLLLHYMRALGSKDYFHYIYCFGRDGGMKSKLEKAGATVVHMGPTRDSIKNPLKFIISLFVLLKDLLGFIKEHRIQIIQSHLGDANKLGIILGKLTAIPVFPTIHNTMAFVDQRRDWDLRRFLFRATNAVVYRIANHIVAVSQEIKQIILKEFRLKESKVLVIKNGIVFDDSSFGECNFKKKLLLMPNTIKLIAVGSLTYQKAFEVLVYTAEELLNQGFDNFHVLIAGDGIERGNLEDLIEKLGLQDRVKLLGIRDDVINLLKNSDMFIMPSRYEGLSISMIEAMACGLPIVASNAPGLWLYINHEQNGLLFPVGDHKALAKSILRVVNDKSLRTRISCGAKHSFETEFDMLKNIKNLDILFRKCTA